MSRRWDRNTHKHSFEGLPIWAASKVTTLPLSGDGAVAQRNSSPSTREVVGLNVDVIVAANSPAGLAAKNATKTIPIVIATMEDPLEQGFATSLAHPGASITGLSLQTPACRAQACLSHQNCL